MRLDADQDVHEIVVRIDVAELACRHLPLVERVTDGLTHGALGHVQWFLLVAPGLDLIGDGFAQRLSQVTVRVGAENVLFGSSVFDLVQLHDAVAHESGLGDVLFALEEGTSGVAPTASTGPAAFEARARIRAVAVDLQRAGGAAEKLLGHVFAAAGAEAIDDHRPGEEGPHPAGPTLP